MKKTDYRLLEEAYTQTRPTPRMVLEAQLQETIEIINEGMWDRLKSDAAGATTGMGKKAIGTLGRVATLGLGGKYNPFNKMVAQGRQAGQEARAASLGKSHTAKLTKEMQKVTQAFNKAIDNYIGDMERQKLIAPGQVNQQTNAVKTEFGNSLQKSQQTVDGLVQQATSMTQAGEDGKTKGGMAQQQVGGAGTGAESGLTGAGTAINQNVIQARTALNKVPGQIVQGAGDLTRQLQNAPGQIKQNFQQGQANADARAGTAPAEGEAPGTPGADTTAKVGELKDELEREKKPRGAPYGGTHVSNFGRVPVPEAIEPEDWDAAEEKDKEGSEDPDFQAQKMATAEAKDKAKGIMDRKGKNVKKENTSPLDIELPYTHLHESNTQSYANNMVQGWRSRLT